MAGGAATGEPGRATCALGRERARGDHLHRRGPGRHGGATHAVWERRPWRSATGTATMLREGGNTSATRAGRSRACPHLADRSPGTGAIPTGHREDPDRRRDHGPGRADGHRRPASGCRRSVRFFVRHLRPSPSSVTGPSGCPWPSAPRTRSGRGSPRAPNSSAIAERRVSMVRPERTDHVPPVNERRLRRDLERCVRHGNEQRCRRSLRLHRPERQAAPTSSRPAALCGVRPDVIVGEPAGEPADEDHATWPVRMRFGPCGRARALRRRSRSGTMPWWHGHRRARQLPPKGERP